MSTPEPETRILKPRDPAIEDDNDWPDFQLSNVEVYEPKTQQMCSLLLAEPNQPLLVHGKLMKNKARISYLVNKKLADSLPIRISIPSVPNYCYGQTDEGEVILWAAGVAGWFELEPSRTYRSIYNGDCEAVKLLYSMADFYRDKKGKYLKTAKVEDIFRQYAAEPANNCEDEEQAEAAFWRHKNFLLDCMKKEKEGINWKATSIFEFLQHESPAESRSPENRIHISTRTEPEDPRSKHAGKGRSTLRPKTSTNPQKGPLRRDSTNEDDDSNIENGSRYLVSLQQKDVTKRRGRPRKSVNSLNLDGSDADADADEDEVAISEVTPIPFKSSNSTRAGNSKRKRGPSVKIVSQSLPSYEPSRPGDVWACTFDGCAHMIYAASTPGSRELIREHYQKHAFDKQAQIDLVLKEERPYLPVGNLVNKLREMAASSQPKQPSGHGREAASASASATRGTEQFYPKPIQRTY